VISLHWKFAVPFRAVGVLLLIAAAMASAGTREETEALLILEQIQAETPDPNAGRDSRATLALADYRIEQSRRWPRGGLVLVCRPNCPACVRLKRHVLTDPRVVAALADYVFTEAPIAHWQQFIPPGGIGFPFIVSIRPGGIIAGRIQCPPTVDGFLSLFPTKGQSQ